MFKNLLNNDEAVSPIVATLVLIVVAIIGAAAVGLIMGTFSTNVADETNTGDIAAGASGNILIAGSTTVQPASELLAKAYMDEHKGVKVTVQGGGSSAGVLGAVQKSIDIGASSSKVADSVFATNPDLKAYEIGGSAVVIIVNDDCPGTVISKAELEDLYDTTAGVTEDAATDVVVADFAGRVYQRSDGSGTEETFAGYLVSGAKNVDNAVETTAVSGNGAILSAVEAGTNAEPRIGFVDFGYANGKTTVKMLGIGTYAVPTSTTVLNALKGQDTYPSGLVKHLYYIVNGEPNSIVNDYLTFAKSPGAKDYFNQAGMFSVYEYTNA